jgi:methylmalonyl-CoA mutase N-terminal domain/subunit
MAIERSQGPAPRDKARRRAAVKTALTSQTLARRQGRQRDLMLALIEAARKGATNGEMIAVMRQAFYWYVSEICMRPVRPGVFDQSEKR